jgi:hypothetical protein
MIVQHIAEAFVVIHLLLNAGVACASFINVWGAIR